MFSTGADGTQVLARVWTASDGFVDTPLGAALLDFAHVYRIVWKADGVEFWVDDVLRHTEPIAIGGTMSVAVSDFLSGRARRLGRLDARDEVRDTGHVRLPGLRLRGLHEHVGLSDLDRRQPGGHDAWR